jgi:hypothetical protein
MIGAHIIGYNDTHRALLQRWKYLRTALLLDPPPGAAGEIKSVHPETFLIGRVFVPDPEVAARIRADPEGAAVWAAGLVTTAAGANPQVDAWTVTNEILGDTVEEIALLNRFSVAYVRLLAGRGLKAAIGCFATGTPKSFDDDGGATWRAFYEAMYAAREAGGVLLLHAYGAPRLYDSDASYFLHRYERRVLPYLPSGLRDLPYVYGEYGCDLGIVGLAQRGWKSGYRGDYRAYAADLLQAARFLAGYPQCRGAAIFTLGAPWGQWDDFNIEGACAEHLATIHWPPPRAPLEAAIVAAGQPLIIPLNKDAMFYKVARQRNLGERLSREYDLYFEGQPYRAQVYERGIVYAPVGRWDEVTVIPREN